MSDFNEDIQPYIDRVGGIVTWLDPKAKILRYDDMLIVRKNFHTHIKCLFDYNGLSIDTDNGVAYGIVLIILAKIFLKEKWITDMEENIYNAYLSDEPYEKEINDFKKKYNWYYRFRPGVRGLLAFIFGFSLFFFLCMLISSISKPVSQGAWSITIIFGCVSLLCYLLKNLKKKIQ